MQYRPIILGLAGVTALAVIPWSAMAAPGRAPEPTVGPRSVVTVEDPADVPRTAVPRSDVAQRQAGPAARSVAEGYFLQGDNRIDDHHYASKELDAVLYRCESSCTVAGRVGVRIRQTIAGGSSTDWQYGYVVNHKSGPGYEARVWYQCARNRKFQSDKYCEEYSDGAVAGSSLTLQGSASTRDGSWDRTYDFGSATDVKKYAQIKFTVTWPSASKSAEVKFRSWDTTRFTTTDAHLQGSSGTGD